MSPGPGVINRTVDTMRAARQKETRFGTWPRRVSCSDRIAPGRMFRCFGKRYALLPLRHRQLRLGPRAHAAAEEVDALKTGFH